MSGRTTKIALTISAILTACSIAAAGISISLLSDAKANQKALEDTNAYLTQQLEQWTGAKTPQETTASDAESSVQETKPPVPDETALRAMLDNYLHAYYDCGAQRSGKELLAAIEGYVTPNAKANMQVQDENQDIDSPQAGNYTYQARVEVNATYLRTLSADSVTALSVCTLTVATSAAETVSTILVRTDNRFDTGSNTWLVDRMAASTLQGVNADQLG